MPSSFAKVLVAVVSGGACLVGPLSGAARADVLQSGGNTPGVIDDIAAGVKEFGFETNFQLAYDKLGDDSAWRLGGMIGPTFRYFLIDRLSLGINGSFMYRRAESIGLDSTLGGLGSIGIDYHLPLKGGLFLYPGISLGGFYGKRELRPDAGDATIFTRSSTYGGVARAGLGLIFYPSDSFNMFARPEAVILLGKNGDVEVSTAGQPTQSGSSGLYLSVDASFNVGMSFVF